MLVAVSAGGCASGPSVPDEGRAADSHAGAGLQLIAADRPEAARSRLERALELRPGHAQALTGMGLLAEAQGDRDEAYQYHRRAAEAASGSGAVLNNWGRALCRRDRVEEALRVLGEAASAEGYRSPEVPLTNAARCALDDGRREQAAKRAEQALEEAPEFGPARTLRGELRYREGALEEAAQDLARAREEGGGARALYWSARVAGARENGMAARRYAKRLAERFPDHAYVERLRADEVLP